MKKTTLVNFIAFFIGIYFIVRGVSFYLDTEGDAQFNQFKAIIYFCLGILAIGGQLLVNYLKKKKEE